MTDTTVPTSPQPNPFDPASLRLDQSFADTVGVKRLLTTVPVRKPKSAGLRACASRTALPAEPSGDH